MLNIPGKTDIHPKINSGCSQDGVEVMKDVSFDIRDIYVRYSSVNCSYKDDSRTSFVNLFIYKEVTERRERQGPIKSS